MPSFRSFPLLRLALVGALGLTLGLAACGRKGPLDPPPGASLNGAAPAHNPSLLNPIAVTPIGSGGTSENSGVGADGKPQAPKGPERSFFLDRLLN